MFFYIAPLPGTSGMTYAQGDTIEDESAQIDYFSGRRRRMIVDSSEEDSIQDESASDSEMQSMVSCVKDFPLPRTSLKETRRLETTRKDIICTLWGLRLTSQICDTLQVGVVIVRA